MSESLSVYLGDELVGRLWLGEGRRYLFQYDEAWLSNENRRPLSISLPLQAGVFEGDAARLFFTNLLPESELRKLIARQLGVSDGNDFSLLEALGGECAGAVTLLPEGVPIGGAGEYLPLNDDELNRLVQEMPMRPMLAGEAGMRLSLAGVQNKLPVFYDEKSGVVHLPKGRMPSLQIMKPPIQHFSHTVENETFCMMLARRMGLPVPNVIILRKAFPLYLVDRYDRVMEAGRSVVRLHQEDFCQALGIAPDMKYENEGGPSLQTCFQLLREYSAKPIADVKALLNWVVFNYLIGNADAHAKNISLLFTERGPELAPFYDLLSTAVYPQLNKNMAMKIGGEYRPEWVMIRHWERFAGEIGVGAKVVLRMIEQIAKRIVSESEEVRLEFEKKYGACDIIDRIMTVIAKRSKAIGKIQK